MNQKAERSLEPSAIPKRTHKQHVLCQAIEQNHQNLERTIQVYVSRVLKNFGNKFDLNCDRNSIETISGEILHNTVETVLKKAEEFDLSYPPLPWIKKFAVNKVRGWQRDKDRQSNKVVPIKSFSSPIECLSEIDRDLMEEEADCFAGELLIPEKACYKLAQSFQGRFGKKLDVLVGRLAPEFLVSKQATKRRLLELEIMKKLERVSA